MNKIETAVSWALSIARDDSHGYDQINRWGKDYDCSSLVISAYDFAGVPVKKYGATYTENMYSAFIKAGFKDVTSKVNLGTGAGLVRGDVLLNHKKHTAIYIGGGEIVHASINEKGTAKGGQVGDQTGREICTRSYYNKPWDAVLRFAEATTTSTYKVVAGDTLWSISQRFSVHVSDLVKWNSIENPNLIRVGQVLRVAPEVKGYYVTVKVNSYLSVRTGPKTTYKEVARLYNGDKVMITEESGNWGKCALGWLHLGYTIK